MNFLYIYFVCFVLTLFLGWLANRVINKNEIPFLYALAFAVIPFMNTIFCVVGGVFVFVIIMFNGFDKIVQYIPYQKFMSWYNNQ